MIVHPIQSKFIQYPIQIPVYILYIIIIYYLLLFCVQYKHSNILFWSPNNQTHVHMMSLQELNLLPTTKDDSLIPYILHTTPIDLPHVPNTTWNTYLYPTTHTPPNNPLYHIPMASTLFASFICLYLVSKFWLNGLCKDIDTYIV